MCVHLSPVAFTGASRTCLPVRAGAGTFPVQPTSLTGMGAALGVTHLVGFLLYCRGQPQGWAAPEAAAAESPDPDAGRGGELRQGNSRSYSSAALGYDFVPGLFQVKGSTGVRRG